MQCPKCKKTMLIGTKISGENGIVVWDCPFCTNQEIEKINLKKSISIWIIEITANDDSIRNVYRIISTIQFMTNSFGHWMDKNNKIEIRSTSYKEYANLHRILININDISHNLNIITKGDSVEQ